ncbi:MAG: hypothetical protein IKU29_12160, partial [Parabacteroides sp.]|nr:hypothetical protein [Parabacteroides sp.]
LVFRNETVDLIEAVENGLCLVNTEDFEWSNQIYMSSVSSFVFRGLHEGDYELHLIQLTKPVVGGDWVQDNRLVVKIHIR